MSKREKIKFEDLEKLGGGHPKPFTEDDLLGLVSDSEKLATVLKTRRVEFFATLFSRLSMNKEFHDKIIDKIEELKKLKE